MESKRLTTTDLNLVLAVRRVGRQKILTGSAHYIASQRVSVVVAAASAQVHVVGGIGARHVGRSANK